MILFIFYLILLYKYVQILLPHCNQKLSAVGSSTPAKSVYADYPQRLQVDK
jgi:hypothetical protein